MLMTDWADEVAMEIKIKAQKGAAELVLFMGGPE